MTPTITICGLDELDHHAAAGVTHVLSILDPQWPAPTAFERYGAHDRLLLRFHDVIEPRLPSGEDAPDRQHVTDILRFGRSATQSAGRPHILVHCHAGISRSTAAAMLMLAQADPERDPDSIMEEIVMMRPNAWPNLRIVEFGDELLGRRGTLIATARRRYREVSQARPEIARFMRDGGRSREVDG